MRESSDEGADVLRSALRSALVEALKSIGPHVDEVVLFHLRSAFGVDLDSDFDVELLDSSLDKLFGVASEIVKSRTIAALYAKLGLAPTDLGVNSLSAHYEELKRRLSLGGGKP